MDHDSRSRTTANPRASVYRADDSCGIQLIGELFDDSLKQLLTKGQVLRALVQFVYIVASPHHAPTALAMCSSGKASVGRPRNGHQSNTLMVFEGDDKNCPMPV